MKYFKQYKTEGNIVEVTYDEALQTMIGSYKDNDITREMLQKAGKYNCLFSIITVTD